MKIKQLLLEGLSLWKIQALIRTDADINKIEIFNQIRAIQGIVVLTIDHSDFLDSKRTEHFEYSLLSFKFIARGNPTDELKRIIHFGMSGPTKIIGLHQFNPRIKTLTQLGKY